MNQDLLRIVDSICRDKNIDREEFVVDLENAIASAMRKTYGETEDVVVKLDRINGGISATINADPVDMGTLGRIAAQTAKQVIIQKTRERERVSVLEEFSERQGTIVTGAVTRIERGNLIVNIGRVEGFLPRSEQIPGEAHPVGARIRVLILEVREQGNQVKIILSRSHPDFIHRLFELEVPEVSERIIEIRALAREAGYRSKVAVTSIDSKVDAVGACVGVRGSRIKNIVDELSGEKIDIVRWNESSQILIQNALKPAEVQEIALCFELGKATVVVAEDQLSLAIGKRGQNVRLAARLTKWDIDIMTPADYNKNLEVLEATVKIVTNGDDVVVDKLIAIGCISVAHVDEVGPEPLVAELELDAELADKIVYECAEEAIRQEEAKEAAAKLKAEQAAQEPIEETPSAFVAEESLPEHQEQDQETETTAASGEPDAGAAAEEAPAPADADTAGEIPVAASVETELGAPDDTPPPTDLDEDAPPATPAPEAAAVDPNAAPDEPVSTTEVAVAQEMAAESTPAPDDAAVDQEPTPPPTERVDEPAADTSATPDASGQTQDSATKQ